MLIYKILLPAEWAEFEAAGRFDGSAFDQSSGFIHCSSRDQVGGTARRLFGQEPALVVVAIDAQLLGESLRWDPTPDGAFPHIYASLPASAVVAIHRIADPTSVEATLPRE